MSSIQIFAETTKIDYYISLKLVHADIVFSRVLINSLANFVDINNVRNSKGIY